jgi:restriction system protein
LGRLRVCSPGFFAKAVVRLRLAMGSGGVAGEGLVTGGAGDAGVDGLRKEDKLGLAVVGLQAKRREGTVGRPVVQGFVGSMDYVRATKGVILNSPTRSTRSFVRPTHASALGLVTTFRSSSPRAGPSC